MTITLEQVRDELLNIIDANPTATGHVNDGPRCEYFLTQQGNPVSDQPEHDEGILGEPVCIVGKWLSLHPDLLEEVEDVVRGNSSAQDLTDLQWHMDDDSGHQKLSGWDQGCSS